MSPYLPWYVRVMKLEPAVLRAALVSIAAIVAQIVGHTVLDDDSITAVINAFTAISALLAGFLIRPGVTPNSKVLVSTDSPLNPTTPATATVNVDALEEIAPAEDSSVVATEGAAALNSYADMKNIMAEKGLGADDLAMMMTIHHMTYAQLEALSSADFRTLVARTFPEEPTRVDDGQEVDPDQEAVDPGEMKDNS